MGMLRLAVCISGVYAAFLLWAIAQERLSKPFPAIPAHPHTPPRSKGDKFPSPLFFNFAQASASATCAAVYLLVAGRGRIAREGVPGVLGLRRLLASTSGDGQQAKGGVNGSINGKALGEVTEKPNGEAKAGEAKIVKKENGHANGHGNGQTDDNANGHAAPKASLPSLLLQVSLFQTTAGPIGFHALKHISYPTMVLAKSCKLIPVLLLNVLLYRRRFGAHKYAVVALVSVGISMFMLFGKKKSGGGDSLLGLGLLVVNLLIDGLTNSTQDQIFALYPTYSGQQMMFIMATIQLSLLLPAMLLPLPSHPLTVLSSLVSPHALGHPDVSLSNLLPTLYASLQPPILLQSTRFLISHPTALSPLAAYAALGGLGQLFIFETIAHFGSLTLVMVTVTRKLFTMLLSVFVFGHQLSAGQWAGVGVVFAGIGVEAAFKRLEALRRVRRDKTD